MDIWRAAPVWEALHQAFLLAVLVSQVGTHIWLQIVRTSSVRAPKLYDPEISNVIEKCF